MKNKLLVLVAAGLVLAAAAGLLVRRELGAREAGRRAEALLAEARSVVAEAEKAELRALAAEPFARADAAIAQAMALLGRRERRAALAAAEAALAEAGRARDLARGLTPIQRAATLRVLRNQVLYRQAEGVAWENARESMSLYDRDRVATKNDSAAVVRFDQGNEMRVEENSVMVVERFREDRQSPTLTMTLSVPEGAVRSQVARTDRDVRLEINLPQARVALDTARIEGGRAEIGTRVHPDQTNRVAVYTGEAEVVGRGGERIVVKRNQFAEVGADGTVSAPHDLPASAITLLPGRNAVVYVTNERPEVTFKWRSDGNCAGYRLEVATDEGFLTRIVDERIERQTFTYGNLRPGRYFWRMSCLDARGTQGPYSETTSFEVVADVDAPRLTVLAPQANQVLPSASVEARCKAEGAVSVFINGEEAAGGGGGIFTRTVGLKPGLNTVVFEAVDGAGNVIYNSRLVTHKP